MGSMGRKPYGQEKFRELRGCSVLTVTETEVAFRRKSGPLRLID